MFWGQVSVSSGPSVFCGVVVEVLLEVKWGLTYTLTSCAVRLPDLPWGARQPLWKVLQMPSGAGLFLVVPWGPPAMADEARTFYGVGSP